MVCVTDRRKRLALLAAIMGSFVAGLDATVVNVALPAIERRPRRRPRRPAVGLQRLPAHARLADPRRRLARRPLRRAARSSRSASAGFGVVSRALRAGAERSRCWSPGARCRASFGALLTPSALAVIVASVPARRARRGDRLVDGVGAASRWSSARWSAAGSSTSASWRWIFAINVPFVIATLVHRAHRGPRAPARAARRCASTGSAPRCARSGWPGPVLRADPPAERGLGLARRCCVPADRRASRCSPCSSSTRRARRIRCCRWACSGGATSPSATSRRSSMYGGLERGVLLPRALPAAGRRLRRAAGRAGDAARSTIVMFALSRARRAPRRPLRPALVHGRRPAGRRGGPRAAAARRRRTSTTSPTCCRRCCSSRSGCRPPWRR